jgi:DNA repair exonuclease SbcCD ATPase subunit
MTDKKLFSLFVIIMLFSFVLFQAVKLSRKTRPAAGGDTKGASVSVLESEVEQLRSVVNGFGKFNLTLHQAFNEEKEKALEVKSKVLDLQGQLKDAMKQKDDLEKELAKLKGNADLSLPVKEKIVQLEHILTELKLQPDKGSEFIAQLENLGKELDVVNAQVPALLSEIAVYKEQTERFRENLAQKEEEVQALKRQFAEAQSQKETLQNTLSSVSGQLQTVANEKALLAQKALDLEKTLNELSRGGPDLKPVLEKLDRELKDAQSREAKLIQEKQDYTQRTEKQKLNLALLSKKNQELVKEVNLFKSQLARLNKDYSDLGDKHATAQLAMKQNEAELSRRKEEVAFIKQRLEEADAKTFEVYSKYKEMKKESALLREQNVSVQLERETMVNDLNQTKAKLNELQNKFQQVSNMFKLAEPNPSDETVEPSGAAGKKVGVELLPKNNGE